VVVCEVLPLVPVTVIVCVPRVARRETVMVSVEVPAPVIELGLKLAVTPDGKPDADKEMAESNPPVTEDVIVTVPELLRSMLIEAGDALMEKPAVVDVTVSETVVVDVVLPDVPVMVIAYVPGVVDDATVKVAVDVPAPVMEDGLKPTVTPEGWPDAVSVIAESKPPLTVLVIVALPELPWSTETEVGEADSEKLGEVVEEPSSALSKPLPLGLPQPVARS
jgi:hypothetical protein